ncbi:hypothetical protein JB92DRAFT_1131711 [Gautieria morchelliformis]|nr:hypothetical protein JB92DRAFT_1131711 [Gautieria morchelliformis]
MLLTTMTNSVITPYYNQKVKKVKNQERNIQTQYYPSPYQTSLRALTSFAVVGDCSLCLTSHPFQVVYPFTGPFPLPSLTLTSRWLDSVAPFAACARRGPQVSPHAAGRCPSFAPKAIRPRTFMSDLMFPRPVLSAPPSALDLSRHWYPHYPQRLPDTPLPFGLRAVSSRAASMSLPLAHVSDRLPLHRVLQEAPERQVSPAPSIADSIALSEAHPTSPATPVAHPPTRHDEVPDGPEITALKLDRTKLLTD